jgi:hypothetical protein
VNKILFGDGLDTYDRVYEPKREIFEDKESGIKGTYYVLDDENLGKVCALKYTEPHFYYGTKTERSDETLIYLDENGVYYYEIDNYNTEDKDSTVQKTPFKDKDGNEYYFYTYEDETYTTVYEYKRPVIKYLTATDKKDCEPVYTDEAQGLYYYYIEYTEPKVEFYYTSVDPTNYKYVKDNAECTSITEIKKMAEKVYSKSYLRSLYEPLFDGFEAVPPVYMENGTSGRLMQYENYESLFSENCVYMFETAEIDTWQSNSSLVRINIKAYLPSEPSKKYDVVIDLALEDGKWYLESPTYLVGNIED